MGNAIKDRIAATSNDQISVLVTDTMVPSLINSVKYCVKAYIRQ